MDDFDDVIDNPMGDPSDGVDLGDAMVLGTGYALFRHGQDRQTAQFLRGLRGGEVNLEVHVHNEGHEEQSLACQ